MLAFLLLLFFIFMLCFPNIVFEGSRTGLLLWFQTVLPTLFPFFIVNALLMKSGAIYQFAHTLSPLFMPLFRISEWSSYAVLGGFFCGTPIGAKIITDLVIAERISKEEGEYLLSFCNNTSPGFIVGFLFEQCLHMPGLAYLSLGILFLSSFLSSLLFRRLYYPHLKLQSTSFPPSSPSRHFSTSGLDDSIYESCETLLKIGGYIMLFCAILYALKSLPIHTFAWNSILLPFLELTNGVRMLTSQISNFRITYVLLMALTSFGGLCAAFQTKCIVQKVGFSFSRYIKEKLITAVVTSFLAYIFILFYK